MPRRAGWWTIALTLAALAAACDNGSSTPDTTDDVAAESDAPDVTPDVPEVTPDIPDVEPDADVVPDADSDDADAVPDGAPPFEGILCGWGICGEGEVCCVTGPPATSEECTSAGECAGDLVLTCDGSEDCGEDERCCMPSGAVMQTTCSAACASGLPLCHAVAECDDGDPATFDYCHPSMCIYPMFERGTICVHSRNEDCVNAVDDDGDTMTDVDDPDCSTFPC